MEPQGKKKLLELFRIVELTVAPIDLKKNPSHHRRKSPQMDSKTDGVAPITATTVRLPGLSTSSRRRPGALSESNAQRPDYTAGSDITTATSTSTTTTTTTNTNHNEDEPVSPRPEDLKPMRNFMKARLYSYGGSNSTQLAQQASGLGARRALRKENGSRPAASTSTYSKVDEPWGAYPVKQRTSLANGNHGGNANNSAFIARRPSPSGKSMASANFYAKRGGRRLRTDRSITKQEEDLRTSSSSVTFAPPPPPQTRGPESSGASGLDVPYGMADSNPDAALENYRRGGVAADDYQYKEAEEEDGEKREEQHAEDKSTTRGDLLRQAQHFKTFMEIMEEHPLYEMPYGDSFLYLKSISGST